MAQEALTNIVLSGFSFVFLVVGLYRMNNGRKERAQGQRIADTETTPVRDLQPGTVEVKGTAQPAEDANVVESPITKTDALATRVEIEEWESGGNSGGNWEIILGEETGVPMTIDDGSGEVRVELPPDGGLNVEQTRTEVGSEDEPPEPVRQYLETEDDVDVPARHNLGPLTIGERRRYSEGMIEPGEEVYVLGTAREAQADWGDRNYVIDEPTEAGDFILSDKPEADLIREGKRGGFVPLAFGGLLTLIGIIGMIYPWLVL